MIELSGCIKPNRRPWAPVASLNLKFDYYNGILDCTQASLNHVSMDGYINANK